MFSTYLQAVKDQHPLVDCITNIVSVNDVANGLLAIDARPVMASVPDEIEAFVSGADALLINLGAMNEEQRTAMRRGARCANRLKKPVILDPVGLGASPLRQEVLADLLTSCQLTAIRGNISELRALAGLATDAGGVDASTSDLATKEGFEQAIAMAKELAITHHTIIAISGEVDIITDGTTVLTVHGGNEIMTRVTGTGCTLTGILAAFVAASPDNPLEASAAAIAMMCVAGDEALAHTGTPTGTGTFRTLMMDALSLITPNQLDTDITIRCHEGGKS